MKENEGERSSTTATLLVVATLPDHHPPIRITEDENCAARIRGGLSWRTNIVAGHGETRPIVTPVCVVF